MRLHSLTATFGKLENETLVLVPGLNIINAPNEWGKSTWCAFLTAMFYGIDTRERTTGTVLADKDHYAPWSGRPMSGRICLTWQGRNITIERASRGRAPMRDFRAYDTDTGVPIPELTADNCGQTLLGVERSVFLRAGFLRLKDLPVTQDESLRRRLNALVTTGEESETGDDLAQKLRDLKNRCRHNHTGLLPQAEAQLAELEKEKRERRELADQIQTLDQAQKDLEGELFSLNNHLSALAYQAFRQNAERVAQGERDLAAAAERREAQAARCRALPGRTQAQEALDALKAFQAHQLQAAKQLQAIPLPAPPKAPQGPDKAQAQRAMEVLDTQAAELDKLRRTLAERTPPAAPELPAGMPDRSKLQGVLFTLETYRRALDRSREETAALTAPTPPEAPELSVSPAQAAEDAGSRQALLAPQKNFAPLLWLLGAVLGVLGFALSWYFWIPAALLLAAGGFLQYDHGRRRRTRQAQAEALAAPYGGLPSEQWVPQAQAWEDYRTALAGFREDQARIAQRLEAIRWQAEPYLQGEPLEAAEARWQGCQAVYAQWDQDRERYRQAYAQYQAEGESLHRRLTELQAQLDPYLQNRSPEAAKADWQRVLDTWQGYEAALAAHRQQAAQGEALRTRLQKDLADREAALAPYTGGESLAAAEARWKSVLEDWNRLDTLQRQAADAEKHLADMKALVQPAPPPQAEDLRRETEAETRHLLEEKERTRQQLLQRRGECLGRMGRLTPQAQLEGQIDALTRRIEELKLHYQALDLALNTLNIARDKLQERFAPRIAQRAQALFARLTGNRYTRLTLRQDLSVDAEAQGEAMSHTALWRSDGTVDQLYLALRLAIAEVLTPEAPFLLDDALVRFDNTRLAAALDILREEADTKQILLFTCQDRENRILGM